MISVQTFMVSLVLPNLKAIRLRLEDQMSMRHTIQ